MLDDRVAFEEKLRQCVMWSGDPSADIRQQGRDQVLAAYDALAAERDVFKIEYESRVIFMDKLFAIIGYDNSDGFHSEPDPFAIAIALRADAARLVGAGRVSTLASMPNQPAEPDAGAAPERPA